MPLTILLVTLLAMSLFMLLAMPLATALAMPLAKALALPEPLLLPPTCSQSLGTSRRIKPRKVDLTALRAQIGCATSVACPRGRGRIALPSSSSRVRTGSRSSSSAASSTRKGRLTSYRRACAKSPCCCNGHSSQTRIFYGSGPQREVAGGSLYRQGRSH